MSGTPLLNGVESHTLGYHVLAAVAANVEGCFVADLLAVYVLALYAGKGLSFFKIALLGLDLGGVIGLGEVEVVGTSGCKCTHLRNYYILYWPL